MVMPRIDLTNKPIAIAGASSGIGAATARACARAGMPVALGARRTDRLQALAAEIQASGGRAIAIECDVTDPDACRRLIDKTERAFGPLFAAFANAGYGYEGSVLTDDEDQALRDIFETNVWGSLHIVRPAIERLRAHNSGGHVLMCSSCLSKLGVPYYGPYCATKAAQDHLGRALRAELASEKIAVSTVHPIGTKTEFFDTAATRSSSGKLAFPTPDAVRQPPEKVARAIVRRLRHPRGGEVWTSLGARTMFAMANAMPGMTDRVLRTAVRKGLKKAER
ncbi:MAG: SDR family NAD(P)-dependent oxidoreductase [Phycisphaerales bacterium]|nr:MAG: SDR family NAD(P)-dependent oxidoreductase [Phycisphaerales bacterium]